jgi:hypothetical protein
MHGPLLRFQCHLSISITQIVYSRNHITDLMSFLCLETWSSRDGELWTSSAQFHGLLRLSHHAALR